MCRPDLVSPVLNFDTHNGYALSRHSPPGPSKAPGMYCYVNDRLLGLRNDFAEYLSQARLE